MPSFSLTDLAKMRLEVLSFFLATFLVSALILKAIWNYLAPDFSWMPRVTYRKSLAILTIAGLFLYVVLTMISGARELMTPGAWKKEGPTYRLRTDDEKAIPTTHRKMMIQNLSQRLSEYATTNNGKFPPQRLGPEIPVESWIFSMDGKISMPFEYIAGQTLSTTDEEKTVIAYEPPIAGPNRFALFSDGSIGNFDWTILREIIVSQRNPK
ncbi:MAG: hypothetical protein P1U89_17980 [Verrucomicrobiales bacterium]|nr:hypothetical protein [Verrucomicrobiales bacterium]